MPDVRPAIHAPRPRQARRGGGRLPADAGNAAARLGTGACIKARVGLLLTSSTSHSIFKNKYVPGSMYLPLRARSCWGGSETGVEGVYTYRVYTYTREEERSSFRRTGRGNKCTSAAGEPGGAAARQVHRPWVGRGYVPEVYNVLWLPRALGASRPFINFSLLANRYIIE